MDTELFYAFGLQDLECLKNLFSGHTVLGISRIIHNAVANLEKSARIITAADRLRNTFRSVFSTTINMCDIIQVDDRAKLIQHSANSSAGVSLEENIISSPVCPTASDIKSSV